MQNKVLLVKLDKPAGGVQHLSFSEPIGLCYLSAVLEKNNIGNRICHLIKKSPEEKLLNVVQEYRPIIIGFSLRNFNFNASCSLIHKLKDEHPEIKIAIGGECIAISNGEELLRKTKADVAFINDSEDSFVNWVKGKNPNDIAGLVFRVDVDKFCISEAKPKCKNPALLPMMNRADLPMSNYLADAFDGLKYATMHVQRGCRYRCTFCLTAYRYKRPLSRTIEQILYEIDYLIEHYGIESIAIWDEDFFADPLRIKQIAQALIDRGSPIRWHTYMKLTDLANKEIVSLLPLLRKSGYERAVIGLESFIPKTLSTFHKTCGPDLMENLKYLTANNIKLCPTYIIGEPDETHEEISYGLDRLMELLEKGIDMDYPYISFITPFPGTPLHDEYIEKGLIIDDNWDHYDGLSVIVKSKCPPDKLIELRDKFYNDFEGRQ